jgi:pilus assembly protein CpaE
MYIQLNAVIVDADENNRRELAGFLSQLGVQIVDQHDELQQLSGTLGKLESPSLVIVNLDPTPQETLRRIATLPRQYPNVNFFLMSQTIDPNLLIDAMHLGIKEFIPLPISQEKFSAAVERVASGAGMAKRARIIHVVSTIGGVGSTTVACNVAASLAKQAKTVLMDLDLVRGAVAGYFDLRPRFTIADVMDTAEKVDRMLLDNALTVHKNSNLAVLGRPEMPEDTQRVNATGVQRLLSILSRGFDFVVLDSIMSVDPIYAAAISAADVNVIVMQLNVPSAKNAERYCGALRRCGTDTNKIRLVVNRYVKKGGDIEPEEIEKAMGMKVNWLIPNDFKNAIGAINYGEPIVLRAPKSEIANSLVGLANSLSGRPAATEIAA